MPKTTSENIRGIPNNYCPILQDILDLHFTKAETSNNIKILKNYKAIRLDSISSEMIKASAPVIFAFLGYFFNNTLENRNTQANEHIISFLPFTNHGK